MERWNGRLGFCKSALNGAELRLYEGQFETVFEYHP
jgi:hypothetical protein